MHRSRIPDVQHVTTLRRYGIVYLHGNPSTTTTEFIGHSGFFPPPSPTLSRHTLTTCLSLTNSSMLQPRRIWEVSSCKGSPLLCLVVLDHFAETSALGALETLRSNQAVDIRVLVFPSSKTRIENVLKGVVHRAWFNNQLQIEGFPRREATPFAPAPGGATVPKFEVGSLGSSGAFMVPNAVFAEFLNNDSTSEAARLLQLQLDTEATAPDAPKLHLGNTAPLPPMRDVEEHVARELPKMESLQELLACDKLVDTPSSNAKARLPTTQQCAPHPPLPPTTYQLTNSQHTLAYLACFLARLDLPWQARIIVTKDGGHGYIHVTSAFDVQQGQDLLGFGSGHKLDEKEAAPKKGDLLTFPIQIGCDNAQVSYMSGGVARTPAPGGGGSATAIVKETFTLYGLVNKLILEGHRHVKLDYHTMELQDGKGQDDFERYQLAPVRQKFWQTKKSRKERDETDRIDFENAGRFLSLELVPNQYVKATMAD